MTRTTDRPGTLLPKSWPRLARSAVLHAITLASTALTVVRGRALDSRQRSLRQAAGFQALCDEVALLREELRLKDARMARLLPSRRPHHEPLERLSILERRSRCGWSAEETAAGFLVEPRTVASWMRRLDEPGERPLVQTMVPVNVYPDFVG